MFKCLKVLDLQYMFKLIIFAVVIHIPPFVILLIFPLPGPKPTLVPAETVTKYFVAGLRLLMVCGSIILIASHRGLFVASCSE